MQQKTIGRVNYSPARAVLVRDDEGTPHKAVHITFAVYVDTKTQTDIVLNRLDDFMREVSEQVDVFLSDEADIASGEVQ